MSEKLLITNGDLQLEAELFNSTNSRTPTALIAHPHPQYGGNMHNNVVSAVYGKFIKENITSLRFNFRGVGRSTGKYSRGKGEINDVEIMLDFLIKERKKEKIGIVGYSYGAAIGCAAVNYSKAVMGYVAISFPWDFMGDFFKKSSKTEKAKFFIQGGRDTVASYDRFQSHFNDYSEPKEYQIIKGADHFYWGYENELAELVLEFFKKL